LRRHYADADAHPDAYAYTDTDAHADTKLFIPDLVRRRELQLGHRGEVPS
jgi:hypothetical protein